MTSISIQQIIALFVVVLCVVLSANCIEGFTPSVAISSQWSNAHHTQQQQQQQLYMFGGAGAGVPSEDRPEEMKQMEEAAKAMGMSVEEYKLGMSARVRLVEALNQARVTGGNSNTVAVERDANNPPTSIKVTITDTGKALGPDKLSAELCKALKTASEKSRETRANEQKRMMQYIGDEMKKIGAK